MLWSFKLIILSLVKLTSDTMMTLETASRFFPMSLSPFPINNCIMTTHPDMYGVMGHPPRWLEKTYWHALPRCNVNELCVPVDADELKDTHGTPIYPDQSSMTTTINRTTTTFGEKSNGVCASTKITGTQVETCCRRMNHPSASFLRAVINQLLNQPYQPTTPL